MAGRVRDAGGAATTVKGDVSRPEDVDALVAAAFDAGDVVCLVNNAGIFPRVPFLEMRTSDWDAVHGVNLRGTFLCTQAVARRLVAAGRGGSVVCLSSSAAFRSSPRGVHYVASKAGVVGFTRAAALELAPHGIRVNAVAPGLTDTAQPRHGMSEDEIAGAAAAIPTGRLSTPADIADTVVFLASDASSQITGQTLHVNGGQFLG